MCAEERYVAPYEALARIYDRVMSHVSYNRWLYFVLDLLQDHGLPPVSDEHSPSILECACGTGNFAGLLAMHGYHVEAFDGSPEMIEVARQKLSGMDNPPILKVIGFNSFEEQSRYDAVLCMYDSVNYLRDPKRMVDFFKRVSGSLKPSGLFLFDVCTEYNSLQHFNDVQETFEEDEYWYTREMKYNEREKLQINRFTIRLDDRPGEEFQEEHVQKIYSEREVTNFINSVGLKVVETCSGLVRKPPDESAKRIHFLCKNK